jgi:GNAT superfamily N-acetyltransferase
MNAEIRPATVADVPALVPLVEQYWAFEDITHFDLPQVSRVLSRALSDPARMSGWVARMDGDAVAYLLAAYVFSLEHLGLTAEIDEFFVLPGARGRGLGNRLLQLAEAEFRARMHQCVPADRQGERRRAGLLPRQRIRRARRLRTPR